MTRLKLARSRAPKYPPHQNRGGEPGHPGEGAGLGQALVEAHRRLLVRHDGPGGDVLEQQVGPSVLRSGEVVGRGDYAEEVAGEPLALHRGCHHADAADAEHLRGREPAPETVQDEVDPEQEDERDQEGDGQVRVVGSGGVNDQARVGGPDVHQDGQEEADEQGASGHEGPGIRSQGSGVPPSPRGRLRRQAGVGIQGEAEATNRRRVGARRAVPESPRSGEPGARSQESGNCKGPMPHHL